MKTQILKVTIQYKGNFRLADSKDYTIVKIVGAPTVDVARTTNVGPMYRIARVGDLIDETQASELADRVQLTTIAP